MAKQTWVKVSGAWKKVKNVWLRVEGVWKSEVIPKSNVDGTWKDFIKYILRIYEYGNSYRQLVEGYINGSGASIVRYASNLQLTASGNEEISVVTNIPVDLTSYTTLYVEWQVAMGTSNNNEYHFIASTRKFGDKGDFNARRTISNKGERVIDTLDISELSGEYYIRVHASVKGASSSKSVLEIHRIHGE